MPREKYAKIANKANKKLVDLFTQLVNHIQYQIDTADKDKRKHQFRLRHIKIGLSIIKKHPEKITSGDDLSGYDGVGSGIKRRIDEILTTGKLAELKNGKKKPGQLTLKQQKIIEELTKVEGIGRVIAKKMVVKHKIKSVADLKKKWKEGKIELNDNILIGLKFYGKFEPNIPRKEITATQKLIKRIIGRIDKNLIVVVAGSYRRGKATSNDIDLLVTHKKLITDEDVKKSGTNYLERVVDELKKGGVIVEDITFKSRRTKYRGFSRYKDNPIRRIDIIFVPYLSYYPALLYFTGSSTFNVRMRAIAKKKGYKLNEHGLFKDGTNFIKVNSEKNIFDELGMEYVEPVDR